MGIDFLVNYGARRVRDYDAQPLLLTDGQTLDEDADDAPDQVGLSCEVAAEEWQPLNVLHAPLPEAWVYRPLRFVDGKDVGRTVAWLQSRQGYPVPVRLSQIGAVVMRDVDGELRREFGVVERVVSLMTDLFPWEEVESFAVALRERGFRLLPVTKPGKEQDFNFFDFERMRKTTQNRSNDEMVRLECQVLAEDPTTSTIVDGRLEPRTRAFDPTTPVAGVIKSHSKNYLHPKGWQTFYQLTPGQRTPAFRLTTRNLDVISWYLRLDGADGELPNWGVVRVEVAKPFLDQFGTVWPSYLDQLSRLLYLYRCRDQSYGRAAVSLLPIQEAERSLGACLTEADALVSIFYRMTNL